ncbi:MAG: hypothetical protein AAF640_03270 [Pseudomonadota bacterium]
MLATFSKVDCSKAGFAVDMPGGRHQHSARATVRTMMAALLATLLSISPVWAQSSVDEKPGAFAMAGDLVIARPLGAVLTVAGTAAFLVSLPLTALSGSVAESAETLVLGPAETTFMRCLGCIEPGYSYKDVERRRATKERRAQKRAEEAAAAAEADQDR